MSRDSTSASQSMLVVSAARLSVPNEAQAIVLFADGSGSSRLSPRDQFVAAVLRRGGFGTLLLDLSTSDEEDPVDIALLAGRVVAATDWLTAERLLPSPQVGYFAASTGAAAALVAAAKRPATVGAIVSRGGRPDLAEGLLTDVTAATLFIVGEHDDDVIALNQAASRIARFTAQGSSDRCWRVESLRGARSVGRGGRPGARMVRAVSWHPTGDARRRRGTLTSIAVGAAAGHDEYGTVGPADDLLGDAAEERPANTRSAVCSHDDEIGHDAACVGIDLVGGITHEIGGQVFNACVFDLDAERGESPLDRLQLVGSR